MEQAEKRKDREGGALKKKGDRRAFLAGAAGAAVGMTAATLLPQAAGRAEAAPGDPLVLGQGNDAGTDPTGLTASVDDGNALMVSNLGSGDVVGLAGSCPLGTGVHGFSDTTYGVEGHTRSTFPPGVDAAGVAGFGLDPAGGDGGGPAPGVKGFSGTGPGVYGASGSGIGVVGESQSGNGVEGRATENAVLPRTGYGVLGTTSGERRPFPSAGVLGVSHKPGVVDPQFPEDLGPLDGVQGVSGTGTGVGGVAYDGVGVYGLSPGSKPAVAATSGWTEDGLVVTPDGGLALDVVGKARFSTAGSGAVRRWRASAFVGNPAVTADSHITVTFTGDPRGASVAWVERQAGVGFIVHLSAWTWRAIPFTYLIVEPPA